ncbi:MAG TPA: uracil-DNA glycosylase family protein [Phycisphaerae bacterium]|nr:uracil-DNA glycosylase family protein [Phycisphaerae bacterium]
MRSRSQCESPCTALHDITRRLVADLRGLRFGPLVACVYNPLEYAAGSYRSYLDQYARIGVEAVFMGMNPGPWGMAQTGVPFGEVTHVRDWLGIDEPVGQPARLHPKRPVAGFACHRREVSGARLWGWVKETFGMPERFFARFFIANYCPLCFMEKSGRNLTPDKLPPRQRARLLAACDRALRDTIQVLQPRRIIGIGAFAEKRARLALADLDIPIGRIAHPSPASPVANNGWRKRIEGELKKMGIKLPG